MADSESLEINPGFSGMDRVQEVFEPDFSATADPGEATRFAACRQQAETTTEELF